MRRACNMTCSGFDRIAGAFLQPLKCNRVTFFLLGYRLFLWPAVRTQKSPRLTAGARDRSSCLQFDTILTAFTTRRSSS